MGEQLKQLTEAIENKELMNKFGPGRLPLIKNQIHFKDPATEPKNTFLMDLDEEKEEKEVEEEKSEISEEI